MHLRSAFVCTLMAMIACASAQDVPNLPELAVTCKRDGAAQAAKVAQEACISVLAACQAGAKWYGTVSTKGFDTACKTEAFKACAGDTSTSMTLCKGAPTDGVTVKRCAATDFKYLYQEDVNDRCSDIVLKLGYPSPKTSGTNAVTRPAENVTPAATGNAGGAAGETGGDHDAGTAGDTNDHHAGAAGAAEHHDETMAGGGAASGGRRMK